jgi:hypothetical protein
MPLEFLFSGLYDSAVVQAIPKWLASGSVPQNPRAGSSILSPALLPEFAVPWRFPCSSCRCIQIVGRQLFVRPPVRTAAALEDLERTPRGMLQQKNAQTRINSPFFPSRQTLW